MEKKGEGLGAISGSEGAARAMMRRNPELTSRDARTYMLQRYILASVSPWEFILENNPENGGQPGRFQVNVGISPCYQGLLHVEPGLV